MQSTFNDAGREGFKSNERGDCAVRAFALMHGLEYKLAWGALSACCGRRPRSGTSAYKFYDLMDNTCMRVKLPACLTKVSHVLRVNPNPLVISVDGHVLYADKGIRQDGMTVDTKVKRLWIKKPC